jgi:serine/threonine-protein kinase HipA
MNRSAFSTPRCPGSLKEGFSGYSPSVLRNLFEGKKVFHVLEQSESELLHSEVPDPTDASIKAFRMALVKNVLQPSLSGDYLLRTVSDEFTNQRFNLEKPANIHGCLQLASQIFEMDVVPNALIFFKTGKPALICRYFPKLSTFQNLEELRKVYESHQRPVKSYLQLLEFYASLASAKMLVREHVYKWIVFSWLVGNAGAHTKTTGMVKLKSGDFMNAPLFESGCSRIHALTPELALPGGLYDGDKSTPEYRENGFYTRHEFTILGEKAGLMSHRIEKILDNFVSLKGSVSALINKAFLPAECIAIFNHTFSERISRLK